MGKPLGLSIDARLFDFRCFLRCSQRPLWVESGRSERAPSTEGVWSPDSATTGRIIIVLAMGISRDTMIHSAARRPEGPSRRHRSACERRS